MKQKMRSKGFIIKDWGLKESYYSNNVVDVTLHIKADSAEFISLLNFFNKKVDKSVQFIFDNPPLTRKEKNYLKAVIDPFRNKISYICKFSSDIDNKDYISIVPNNDVPINFPYFQKGIKYKNMEANRKYTLEELDL